MGINLNEGNDFIGKKTTRNTIIINDEEGVNVKHHSAPIKMLSNKNMFETHLLKKQIEEREDDKQFKCGHNGCDLAFEGYTIYGKIIIHHINPISLDDIMKERSIVFDPENLVCVSFNTHNAIHYGDSSLLSTAPIERTPNDTCPWR